MTTYAISTPTFRELHNQLSKFDLSSEGVYISKDRINIGSIVLTMRENSVATADEVMQISESLINGNPSQEDLNSASFLLLSLADLIGKYDLLRKELIDRDVKELSDRARQINNPQDPGELDSRKKNFALLKDVPEYIIEGENHEEEYEDNTRGSKR